jgi:hypothetical protein
MWNLRAGGPPSLAELAVSVTFETTVLSERPRDRMAELAVSDTLEAVVLSQYEPALSSIDIDELSVADAVMVVIER